MKSLVASVFALVLLATTAASAEVGAGVHVGNVVSERISPSAIITTIATAVPGDGATIITTASAAAGIELNLPTRGR
jgi:hypothetical protein